MERLFTIKDVAHLLNKSTKTVRRRAAAGIIPFIQEGGRGTELRFHPDDIADLIERERDIRKVEIEVSGDEKKTKRPGRQPAWKQQINQITRKQ